MQEADDVAVENWRGVELVMVPVADVVTVVALRGGRTSPDWLQVAL